MEAMLRTGTTTAAKQCATCPFRQDGLDLGPEKMNQIRDYLLKGTNHLCHSDRSNRTICRGGRNFQLEIWHRLGIIAEPTDEALVAAMKAAGVEPGDHL